MTKPRRGGGSQRDNKRLYGTAVAAIAPAMRVRLTRKFADQLDGVDLRAHNVGDVLDLPAREARLLLAEEWAEPARHLREARREPAAAVPSDAGNEVSSPDGTCSPRFVHGRETDGGEIVTS